jgi:cation transport protein ChaC
MRSVWLEDDAWQRVSALAYGSIAAMRNMPDGSLIEQLHYVQQGHAAPATSRYVLATVKSIEAV